MKTKTITETQYQQIAGHLYAWRLLFSHYDDHLAYNAYWQASLNTEEELTKREAKKESDSVTKVDNGIAVLLKELEEIPLIQTVP